VASDVAYLRSHEEFTNYEVQLFNIPASQKRKYRGRREQRNELSD
jgi:hypothetical protein